MLWYFYDKLKNDISSKIVVKNINSKNKRIGDCRAPVPRTEKLKNYIES